MSGETISKLLYVHDPSQPDAPGLETSAEIQLKNSHCISLTKPDGDCRVRLTVSDPLSLGLPKLDDYYGDEFMRHVIMACNLVMNRVAFSTCSLDSSHVMINVLRSSVSITDSVAVKVGRAGVVLDEVHAIDALENIRYVFDAGDGSSLKIHNLQKSLDRYLDGTQGISKSRAFGSIYESLEHATNFDADRTGDDFDKEVCNVTGDNTSTIEDLRCLNNRIKHADTKCNRAVFDAYKEKLTEKIWALRPIATKVILHRLNNIK